MEWRVAVGVGVEVGVGVGRGQEWSGVDVAGMISTTPSIYSRCIYKLPMVVTMCTNSCRDGVRDTDSCCCRHRCRRDKASMASNDLRKCQARL